MGYSNWVYIGSEESEDTYISRFENRHIGSVEEVALTNEEAKHMTFGNTVERLLRQVGESRWQDEFASMLSNMMNSL